MILYHCDSKRIDRALEHHDTQRFSWGEVTWVHEPVAPSNHRTSVAVIKMYPDAEQEGHFHTSEEQILYVVEGEGRHRIDGREYPMEEASFLYCPPNMEHQVKNTGDGDLILVVIYVPTKFKNLEPEKTHEITGDLKDALSPDVLESLERELGALFQLTIHFLDAEERPLVRERSGSFCAFCEKHRRCTKTAYQEGSGKGTVQGLYACDLGLGEIKRPITIGGEGWGFISCEKFILEDAPRIDEKLRELADRSGESEGAVRAWFYQSQRLLKSRIYTIEEHLDQLMQLLGAIVERRDLEREISRKDWEILQNAKEKIQLKDRLTEATAKLAYQGMFDQTTHSEEGYPLGVELDLTEAIKEGDATRVAAIVDEARGQYRHPEAVVEEMVVVFVRTLLSEVVPTAHAMGMRNSYLGSLRRLKAGEGAWDLLLAFSLECVELIKRETSVYHGDLVERVNQYLLLNYDKKLSLNQLADTFYISPNYLSTLFNEKNGMPIADYINALRIEKAKDYLEETGLKVKEIAMKLGYNSASYFINVFRGQEKMTPGAYRKQVQDKKDKAL